MIRNYFDFIKEGHNSSDSPIYWSESLEKLINEDWTEISTKHYSDDIYFINFKAGNDRYDYYSVLANKSDDTYLMDNPENFIQKFRTEFWKDPAKYIENMKRFKPKCLGDLSHVELSSKYNI